MHVCAVQDTSYLALSRHREAATLFYAQDEHQSVEPYLPRAVTKPEHRFGPKFLFANGIDLPRSSGRSLFETLRAPDSRGLAVP
jgi:hypothetical protein